MADDDKDVVELFGWVKKRSLVLGRRPIRLIVLTSSAIKYYNQAAVRAHLGETPLPAEEDDTEVSPTDASAEAAAAATDEPVSPDSLSFGLDVPAASVVQSLIDNVAPRGEFRLDKFENVNCEGLNVVMRFTGSHPLVIQLENRTEVNDWQITVRQTYLAMLADQRVAASLDRLAADVQRIIPSDIEKAPRPIGAGGAGQVYRGRFAGFRVAVKELYSTLMDPTALDELVSECNIMVGLKHPAIVKLYGVGRDRRTGTFCIVMELAAGSLYDWVHKSSPGAHRDPAGMPADASPVLPTVHSASLSDPWQYSALGVTAIFQEIASGMRYVHSLGIVHRDLKPSNILLDQSGHVRICDFGLSRHLAATALAVTGDAGTAQYMAPEMFAGRVATYSNTIDVYAFGVMLWEACTRTLPYNELYGQAAVISKARHGARPPLPLAMPAALRVLIQRCWSRDPKNRPSFVEIEKELAAELQLHKSAGRGRLIPCLEDLARMQFEAVRMRCLKPGPESDLEAMRAHELWGRRGAAAAAGVTAMLEQTSAAAVAGVMASASSSVESYGAGAADQAHMAPASTAEAELGAAETAPGAVASTLSAADTAPGAPATALPGETTFWQQVDMDTAVGLALSDSQVTDIPPPTSVLSAGSSLGEQEGWPSALPFLESSTAIPPPAAALSSAAIPSLVAAWAGVGPSQLVHSSPLGMGLLPATPIATNGLTAVASSASAGSGHAGIPRARLGQLLQRQRSVGQAHDPRLVASHMRSSVSVGGTGGRIEGPIHQHWSRWSVNSLIAVDLSPSNILALHEHEAAIDAWELMSQRPVASCPVYREQDVPQDASEATTAGSDASSTGSRSASPARRRSGGNVATEDELLLLLEASAGDASHGASPPAAAAGADDRSPSPRRLTTRRGRAGRARSHPDGFSWAAEGLMGRGSTQDRFVERKFTPKKCLVTGLLHVLDTALIAVQVIAETPGADQIAERFATAHGRAAEAGSSLPQGGFAASTSALFDTHALSADGEAAFRVQAASQMHAVLASLPVVETANASGRSHVVCITTGVPVPNIVRIMSSGCGRLLVVNKEGFAVGMPTVSSLLQRLHKEPEAWQEVGKQVLCEALHLRKKPSVRTCSFKTPLWVALQQLQATGAEQFAVVDDRGRLRATLSPSCVKTISSAKGLLQPLHKALGLALTAVAPTDGDGREGLEAEVVVKLPATMSRTRAIAQPGLAADEALAYRRDNRFAGGNLKRAFSTPLGLGGLAKMESFPAIAEKREVLSPADSPPTPRTGTQHAAPALAAASGAAADSGSIARLSPLASLLKRCLQRELDKAAARPRKAAPGRARGADRRQPVGAQPTAKQQARKRSKAIVISKNDTLHRVCGLFVRFKAQRVYLVDDELRPQVAISPTDIIDCLATWLDEHDAAGTAINTDLP